MGDQPADTPTVDSWSDKDQRIVVSQPAAGFLYDLVLRAKVDADPDAVYDVLKYPNSHEIFRGIKATLSRTTLEDDGKGRRKLRVGHRALTKFLWISVTFDTELFVWEDDIARTIRFTNARSDGFMTKFDGTWHVQPFTQQTLDSIYKGPASSSKQSSGHNWLGGLLHNSGHQHNSSGSEAALVTLNQALAPRARPPGPVAHLVRGLCGRVLTNMMQDLRLEVERRQQLEAAQQPTHSSTGRQSFFSPASAGTSSKQSAGRTSLPVASLTLSSSTPSSRRSSTCSSSTCSSSSSSSSSSAYSRDDGGSEDRPAVHRGSTQLVSAEGGTRGVLAFAAESLGSFMTAAVPLHITIQL